MGRAAPAESDLGTSESKHNEISVDRPEDGVAIVAICGEHETFSAPKLASVLDGLFAERVAVVADLTEAEFLDSSVIGALIRARGEARDRGLRFAVVVDDSTGWAVKKLLDVTGLLDVFDIRPDRASALAAVRGA